MIRGGPCPSGGVDPDTAKPGGRAHPNPVQGKEREPGGESSCPGTFSEPVIQFGQGAPDRQPAIEIPHQTQEVAGRVVQELKQEPQLLLPLPGPDAEMGREHSNPPAFYVKRNVDRPAGFPPLQGQVVVADLPDVVAVEQDVAERGVPPEHRWARSRSSRLSVPNHWCTLYVAIVSSRKEVSSNVAG